MTKDVRSTSRSRTLLGRSARLLIAGATACLTMAVATAGAQTTSGAIRGYVRGPNAIPAYVETPPPSG